MLRSGGRPRHRFLEGNPRHELRPRIDTTEIHDTDLDSISGGVAVAAAVGLHVAAGPLAVCADVDAFASLEGVAANAKASAFVA